MHQTQLKEFLRLLNRAIEKETLVKIILTNKRQKDRPVNSLIGRLVKLKDKTKVSIVSRTDTQDTTKNHETSAICEYIEQAMEHEFYQAMFEIPAYSYYLTIFNNGKAKLRHKKNTVEQEVNMDHDRNKKRLIPTENNLYLQELGLLSNTFQLRSKAQDKYKQINKYVEIIDDILKKQDLPKDAHIVDMGSGKGYLTFALYDYYTRIRKQTPTIKGIELRKELVKTCNDIARKCKFDGLEFIASKIQDIAPQRIDCLIALHACDTATDEAIFKGIRAKSSLIICAPCCHKQVRKRMYPEDVLHNITQHGILKERQAEILTDTIRAMLMEAWGYKTRVFEFINTSHTPKNVLIVGQLDEHRTEADVEIMRQVKELREKFGISYHYLERILSN